MLVKGLLNYGQSRGLTQARFGEAIGVSQRVVAYYETQNTQPPGALLVEIARVLHVSTDELLGAKPIKIKTSRKTARLMKRLQKVEKLPPSVQRAILKFIDALTASKGAQS